LEHRAVNLPKVAINLKRTEWVRLAIVGFFVAFAVARTAPDVVRLGMPLGYFDYVTNANGVVIQAPASRPKGTDELRVGDRVRIDRVPPFDRKPGLARLAFTLANFDRRLPIERAGRERIVRLSATSESLASRAVAVLRIALLIIAIAFVAILVIVKPTIATAAFFMYCIGGIAPTTYADVFLDNPWRQIPQWFGDTLHGVAPAALLLFALCLLVDRVPLQRILAVAAAALALALGTLNAYADWRLTYAGLPAQSYADAFSTTATVLTIATVVALLGAVVRARGAMRQRTGWIVAAFALAGVARLASDQLFPGHITLWQNGLLLSLTLAPVIVVWVAVVKHHFFDVDFVVSRALVYAAITAAMIGIVAVSEELFSYIFYNNVDLAYGVLIAISMGAGAAFGKVKDFLDGFVDRFIFRERHAQRRALERIAANMFEAETTDTVYRSLLQDAPSVLDLSFGGVMMRTSEGGYELGYKYNWPDDCVERLPPGHALVAALHKSRGMLALDDPRSTMIKTVFPNERLTFAAPIYFDREVSGLVLYGHSVSGLDLDPDERVLLMRVVANASLALSAIELSRYRAAASVAWPAPERSGFRPAES
jgi:hypothetical protein